MTLPAIHVDNQGLIRDSSNNIVYLRGVNTAGTEFGIGFGNGQSAWVSSVSSQLSLNIWRLAINASWWNNNSAIPAGYTYRAWIDAYIGWIKAANCYVEISPVTAFCTTTGNPPQNFLDSCNSTAGVADWDNKIFPAYNTFYTNFVPLYKNDPMVLYNLSNEPIVADAITQQKNILTTIRAIDPTKLVFADSRNYVPNITNAVETNYVDSNLVVDWHIYDDPTNWWYQKFSTQNPNVSFGVGFAYAQAHSQGVVVGEYNTAGAWNSNGFATEMVRRAFSNGIGNQYYNDGNLASTVAPYTLTASGLQIAAINAQIAAGPARWV